MAFTYNAPARVERNAEFGHVWEEKLTNAQGSIEVPKYTAVRVRASAGTTVTIDGVLAATMAANEVIIFNAGIGASSDSKKTVTVTIAGANAWVQVARMTEPDENKIS